MLDLYDVLMAAESVGVHVVIAVGIVKTGVGFFSCSGDAGFAIANDGAEVDNAGFDCWSEGENTTYSKAPWIADELLLGVEGVEFGESVLSCRK